MKIAYKRVSTIDQNLDRQLAGEDFDREFVEKASAKDLNRPKLKEMLDFVREGDTIFVHDLSRLARSVLDLNKILSLILEKKASIVFQTENWHFSNSSSTAIQKLLFDMLGAVAEFERNITRERQKEGIEQAKKKGKYPGRKSKLSQENIKEIKQMFDNKVNRSEIAEKFGLTRRSIYRIVKEKQK